MIGSAHAVGDAPRFLQLYRESLQKCGGVLVNTATGIADSLLLGGEIAWPGADGSQGVALHTSYTGGTLDTVDTVDGKAGASGTLVLSRGGWWHKPFLGELFPVLDRLSAVVGQTSPGAASVSEAR